MRFLSFVRCAEGGDPPPELFAAMEELMREAMAAGVLVDTRGLMPTAAGARARLSGGRLTVTDGPFTEAKEVIGGLAVFEVASREEMLEWTRRFMELHREHWPEWEGEAEIRQVMDASAGERCGA